jgi:hypothetical protein
VRARVDDRPDERLDAVLIADIQMFAQDPVGAVRCGHLGDGGTGINNVTNGDVGPGIN